MSDFLAVTTKTFQVGDGSQLVIPAAEQPRRVQCLAVGNGPLYLGFDSSVAVPSTTVSHRSQSVGVPLSLGVDFILEAGEEVWVNISAASDNTTYASLLVTRTQEG